jgi:5'-nucleotidase
MRILVTNDDGIDSIGLHVLARSMRQFGEVVVAAPDQEFSGASAAIGAIHLMQPEVHRRAIEGMDNVWAVSGPPALCVFFARLGLFGAPFDLVVSGINPGANVGRSVYHSGTVGAAITARNGGVTGIAVSQAVTGFGVEGQGWDDAIKDQQWDAAATVARSVVSGWIASNSREPAAINVNVPNLPVDRILGWRRTDVGYGIPRAMSTATMEPKEGHADSFHVRMAWGDEMKLDSTTDGGTVEDGLVSITYLNRFHDSEHPAADDVNAALDGLVGAPNSLRS